LVSFFGGLGENLSADVSGAVASGLKLLQGVKRTWAASLRSVKPHIAAFDSRHARQRRAILLPVAYVNGRVVQQFAESRPAYAAWKLIDNQYVAGAVTGVAVEAGA
jgi:hypothetical protein